MKRKLPSEKAKRYAMKFNIDAPFVEPSFENLERVLSNCARRPLLIWLPSIRKQVQLIRKGER